MSATNEPVRAQANGRGYVVVVAMFALALVAASFAWYVNFNRGRRTLELFGPEAATLIRTAPKVELVVEPDTNVDLSKAPGLLNARTSLLNDASYEWTAAETSVKDPLYSVRFSDDQTSIVVLFDLENGVIQEPSGKSVKLTKKTAAGWRTYLARHVKTR